MTETINIAPNWRASMQILIACLENGTEEGKANARTELLELADKLDAQNARDQIEIPERIEITARAQALDPYERKMICMTLLASMLGDISLGTVLDEINGIYLSGESHDK